MITVPIHKGEARVRGQLAYDNPDVTWHKYFIPQENERKEYIMPGGNLSGVYSFYTMAVTAATKASGNTKYE